MKKLFAILFIASLSYSCLNTTSKNENSPVDSLALASKDSTDKSEFVNYIVDTKNQEIKLYWKDENQQNFKSIYNLKNWLAKQNITLLFAMNGGMYMEDNSPQGLFIEDGLLRKKLNTAKGKGNFYLQPNGVFYIMDNNIARVCISMQFSQKNKIKYATQSGPMLVIDGKIHPVFTQGSKSLYIRNGVGILPDGKVLFAMSKKEINFYDFAQYFIARGCKNALYLDGAISQTYLPEKGWIQTGGNFGVIIGVTQKK